MSEKNIPSAAKIKIKYSKDEEYYPVYANGVLGGATIRNEIVLNFYSEVNEIPNHQIFPIENGKLGKELANERSPKLVDNGVATVNRKIIAGIIMQRNEIKQVHKWLGEQIAIMEQRVIATVRATQQNDTAVKQK